MKLRFKAGIWDYRPHAYEGPKQNPLGFMRPPCLLLECSMSWVQTDPSKLVIKTEFILVNLEVVLLLYF